MQGYVVRATGGPLHEGLRRKRQTTRSRGLEVPFDHDSSREQERFRRFIGWEVLNRESHDTVGVIEDVVCLEEEASLTGHSYFRVVQNGNPPAKHFIPIVAEMIPAFRPEPRQVVLTAPQGLLELGENHARMEDVKQRLLPYAHPEKTGQHWKRLEMPSLSLLEKEGREDLIKEINDLGGFTHVATVFGWKSIRKPWGRSRPHFSTKCERSTGYWDDMETLDKEIRFFVAASWIEAEGVRGSYYYNAAIHKIQWEKPVLPDVLQIHSEPILIEEPEDRLMPTKESVMNSGRWDLHHAINAHGGYRCVGLELDRAPSPRASKPLEQIAASLDLIHHFLQKRLIRSLPYLTVLKSYGEPSVVEAVKKVGSIKAVSRLLNIPHDYRPRAFAKKRGAASHNGDTIEIAVRHIASFLRAHGSTKALPTQRELIQAGRYDLKYAIEKFGRAEIQAQLNVLS